MQSVPQIQADSLLCGEDYSISFNAGTYLFVQHTTATAPIVVTVPNHGFANGQTKFLDQCADGAADGEWVIGNVTTNTFTLTGSSGLVNGVAQGICTTPYNITGKTIRATLRAGVTKQILGQTFTITINDPLLCDITLSISRADTKAIQTLGLAQLYTDVWADDVPLCATTIPVYPAGTIF